MKQKKNSKSFYPGYNFGMKKTIVKAYGKEDEIKRIVVLLDQVNVHKRQISLAMSKLNVHGNGTEDLRRHRIDMAEIRAELRGLRKLFRTRHTDSFEHGLYTYGTQVHPYQLSIPAGKVGHMNGWYRKSIQHSLPKNSLLMWSCRDELGNCEFIVSDTGYVIKIPRGHSTSDYITPVKEK
tara:strand:- start:40 stop:579 length:540 start_codon:yes stop_codon:yes gene_type:complete